MTAARARKCLPVASKSRREPRWEPLIHISTNTAASEWWAAISSSVQVGERAEGGGVVAPHLVGAVVDALVADQLVARVGEARQARVGVVAVLGIEQRAEGGLALVALLHIDGRHRHLPRSYASTVVRALGGGEAVPQQRHEVVDERLAAHGLVVDPPVAGLVHEADDAVGPRHRGAAVATGLAQALAGDLGHLAGDEVDERAHRGEPLDALGLLLHHEPVEVRVALDERRRTSRPWRAAGHGRRSRP